MPYHLSFLVCSFFVQGKKTYSYLRNIGLDFELVEDQFCLTSFYNENGSTQNGITCCFYSPFII